MNIRLLFDIAKSLLLARWRQTLVAAIGVKFSITMFIALLSFMIGLNEMLDGLVMNRIPHVRLYNEISPSPQQPIHAAIRYPNYHHFIHSVKANKSRQALYNNSTIIQLVQQDERVLGLTPRLTTQVFFNNGIVDITGIMNGIDATEESRLFHFSDYIISGDANDLKTVSNSIILGKPLAEKLNVELGEVVQITTAEGERFSLKVVGFFQSGLQDFDKVQSYASITTVQKLLGQPANYITDIHVKLKNLGLAPVIANEYQQLFRVKAEDFQSASAEFETGSFIRSLIAYCVGITLLIVAGFGIYNILNMMIYEKMDAIAILKATGFSGRDVKFIFLIIAVSIGLSGGIAGLLLGYMLSLIIDQVPFITSSLPTITTYPVNYNPILYIIATSFSLVTTYLSGWFPARKASKIDPVIIIRGK